MIQNDKVAGYEIEPVVIVMDDEWASRYAPRTFTMAADPALRGTLGSVELRRTYEGHLLASEVEFLTEGIRFTLLDGKSLSFSPEYWARAWLASSTPKQALKWDQVTEQWLDFMFDYRPVDGTRGREKNRVIKDYLVNTVQGLRYLHEKETGEELSIPGAVEQVEEARTEGKEGFYFPDDKPLPWPAKWKTSGALVRELNRDRKEAANIMGWDIKRGRPKGKKTDE